MAVTDQQKLDFLLKKIGYTKTKTGSVVGTGAISGTPKQPFAEAIPSPLIIANGALWNEADSIPTTPPGADTNQVKVYLAATSGLRMTADATSSGQRAYIAYSTYGNTSSTRLTNWIDTQFGASYIIKVYRGDPNSGGVNLSAAGSGANDGWFFDYSAGVLNFNDTNVPSGVTDTNIYIVGYRYIGQTGAPTSGISTFSYLDLTVERNLDVGIQGGISTFRNNIDLNADLDVDGHTNLDNVSIAGVTTTTGHIYIDADNKRLFVGADSDISIYNDGSNSRIENQTGQLIVKSPIFTVQTGNYNQIISREAAEVDLYYKGVKKFSTASSGINVVGTTTSTQLAITGVSTFTGAIDANGDLDVDGHTNLDNVSIAGVTTITQDLDVDGHTNLDNISVAGVSTFTGDATFSGNVSIGGTLTYEDVTNVDSVGLLTARSGIRVTGGVIEAQAGENKIPSLYSNLGALPSAGTYHGMFAHVHSTGRGYFAHAGNWLELVNKETNGTVGTGTERYNIGPVDLTTLDVSGISTFAGNVDINADIDVDGHTNLDNVSVAGVTTHQDAVRIIDHKELYLGTSAKSWLRYNSTLNVSQWYNITNPIEIGYRPTHLMWLNDRVLSTTAAGIGILKDLDVDGHTNLDNVSIAGVTTFTGAITANGAIDLNSDLDVDGHTNLDNVSIAGVTTMSGALNANGNIVITSATPYITFDDTNNRNWQLNADGGNFIIKDTTDSVNRLVINASGNAFFSNDLDVDGHTNLDNVNIAGVTTTSSLFNIREAHNTAYSAIASPNAFTVGNINSSAATNFTGIHLFTDGNGRGVVNLNALNNSTNASADFTIQTRHAGTLGERFRIASNGNITVNNNLDVDGHTELDNVNIVGVTTHQGHVLPSADVTYDLGSSSKQWRNLYADNIVSAPGIGFIGPDLTVRNFKATGISTFAGNATFNSTITAGGATGSNGQYLKTTGTGVAWASFPTLRTRQTFTASAGQTTFSFSYNVNFVDVFVNGIKLTDAEFTATNGSSVVLAVGCFVGDIVELVSYNTISGGGGGGGSLNNIVEDTTPQLGGNLDLFNKNITGTGNINITGSVTATNFIGNGSGLTGIVASGSGVVIKNSGSTVGTAGTINFGDNLSVSPASAGIVTITAGVTTSQFNVNKLHVAGITTFVGVTTFSDRVDFRGGNYKDVWFWAHPNLPNSHMVWRSWVAGGNGGLYLSNSNIYLGATNESSRTHIDPHGTGAAGHLRIEQYMDYGDNPLRIFSDFTNINGSPTSSHSSRDIADFNYDDGCALYHFGNKKLQTSGIGITVTGTIVATGADINGDIDVDGHTELDNVNIAGVVTATTFKGALQGTSGTFSSGVDITGDLDVDGHTDLDNVSIAGVVTATTFVGALTGNVTGNVSGSSGSTTGNAATATALQNARTIGGVSFDGTANINLPGVNSAGNQNTSGNAATATLATDATSFTVSANNSTNETVYPVFVDGATGSQGAETDTGLTYNPSTGNLTSTKFTGDGSGLTGITASGSGIIVKHDGSTVGTAGTINFSTNLDVSAISAGIVTVTASGGGGDKIEEGDTKVETVDSGDAADAYVTTEVNGTEEIRTIGGQTTVKYLRVGSAWNMANSTGTGIALSYSNTHDLIKGNSSGGLDILHSTSVELGQNGSPNYKYAEFRNTQGLFRTNNVERFRYDALGIRVGNNAVSTGATIGVDGNATFAGIVTATAFHGDGSNLTGISGGGTNVGITTNLSGTFTASAGSPSTINTFAYHDNDKVVEYTVYIKNGSNFQSQKVLAMRDGTTIHSTQFAVMFSSSLLVQCDATISSGNILLRATPESGVSGSTTYKVKREVM